MDAEIVNDPPDSEETAIDSDDIGEASVESVLNEEIDLDIVHDIEELLAAVPVCTRARARARRHTNSLDCRTDAPDEPLLGVADEFGCRPHDEETPSAGP